MNRDSLVREIAVRVGNTKTETNKFLNGFMEIITSTLAKKEEVVLIGFGKFYTTSRAAGKGKNPRTGEAITTNACTTPKFKAGKRLKARLNK